MRHLLVTNDFPPKIGGIQSYLWELWRRLPAEDVTVVTAARRGAAGFDAEQPFRIIRLQRPVLLPTPTLLAELRSLIRTHRAGSVVLDPAFPLGALGPNLGVPYAVVVHGAEVTVPRQVPGARQLLTRTLLGASLVLAAGAYAEAEARRAVPRGRAFPEAVQVPPGVDVDRFRPVEVAGRDGARARFGVPTCKQVVLSVSRLVPRKGMDALIDAAARLAPARPDLLVVIAGAGRDRARLGRQIGRTGAPVRLIGSVEPAGLPSLYAAADLFALCCRNRWGGLEQEGFGIAFLEAAATGLPSVAGASGGSAEAVEHGRTGIVVPDPANAGAVAAALATLLDDPDLARRQGRAARVRAERDFSYDSLAVRLQAALDDLAQGERPGPRSPRRTGRAGTGPGGGRETARVTSAGSVSPRVRMGVA